MTCAADRPSMWMFLAAVLAPILIALAIAAIAFTAEPIMWVLLIIVGILTGFLLFMLVLNWRAERVAYRQIDGQRGAAGQVLASSLRGLWITDPMPVAFNAKTQDCLYRVIGRPGIVLVTEGSAQVTKRLYDDERRKTARIAPNVPIHRVHVGSGEGEVPLLKLKRHLGKLEGTLTKDEIQKVHARLSAIRSNPLPVPKGIDPMRMRPSRRGPR